MENTFIKILKKELVGKEAKIKNLYNREQILEIENVEYDVKVNQLTPDTRENDWWGVSERIERIKITFIDGSSILYNLNDNIEIV